MQTVGEKEHYEKEATKIYKEIRGSLLYHVNSILVGGRTDVTVSPIITNAVSLFTAANLCANISAWCRMKPAKTRRFIKHFMK